MVAQRTYGSATLRDGFWRITCEPHVAMVLKRVCQGIAKHQARELLLSHTPEHCRDLRWFCDRYPLEISPATALAEGVRQHTDRILLLNDMLAGHIPPPAIPLAIPPRAYQGPGAGVARASGSLLLGDDLGLGKTATAIAAIADPAHLPALVVAPAHLADQWAREVARFAPHLQVFLTPGTKPQPLPTFLGSGPDVIVTTYHRLFGWKEVVGAYCRSVVYDEVQELRRDDSAKYSAATFLAEQSGIGMRLGLSATPIYNYGAEFFWVMSALAPGRLGSRDEFLREWCHGVGGDKARIREPEAFGAWLKDQGLYLRRTRREVGRELPPLTTLVQEIDCDGTALEAVGDEVKALAQVLLGTGSTPKERFAAAGNLDWRLRQATGIAKAPQVAAFVNMLIENGEPVILLGWHQAVYDIWVDRLTAAGRKVVRYTGEESATQKAQALEAWKDGSADVFILSLRAGAGLDGLQHRERGVVVFGELDWSPAVHRQCIGRRHRDGINGPVLAYFLVANEGSDPVVAEVLQLKQAQLDGFLNLGADDVVDQRQGDGSHIIRLAEEILRRRGESVPVRDKACA